MRQPTGWGLPLSFKERTIFHMRRLFIVGLFPPPVHGHANVNEKLFNELIEKNFSVIRLNTATPQLAHGAQKIKRIEKILKCWINLGSKGRGHLLYLPLSGGLGQVYDVVTLFLSRMLGMKCIFHHHSTAYLFRRKSLTRLLFMIPPESTFHIVLCDAMALAIKELYGVKNTFILSNLSLFPISCRKDHRTSLTKAGCLSYVTPEKGAWDLIKLSYALKEAGLPVEMEIAGPCFSNDIERALIQARHEGVLKWHGPLYGQKKEEFLNRLDLFLFPTRYRDEAEPLVLWEAMSHGMPIIANNRGCIRAQVGQAGLVVEREDDFIEVASKQLNRWSLSSDSFREAVETTVKHYNEKLAEARCRRRAFFDLLKTLLE